MNFQKNNRLNFKKKNRLNFQNNRLNWFDNKVKQLKSFSKPTKCQTTD